MLKKNNKNGNCLQKTEPELRKTRLPPSLRILHGFVRRNVIGHYGWNGWELTNQLRQHISSIMEYAHVFLVLSFWGRGWTKKTAVIGVETIV